MIGRYASVSLDFSQLFGSAGLGVLLLDRYTSIKYANNFILEFTGFQLEQLIDQQISVLVAKGTNQLNSIREFYESESEYADIQIEKTAKPVQIAICRSDESLVDMEASFGFLKTEDDNYLILFLNDVSVLQEKDQLIRQLEDEIEQRIKESSRSLSATVEQLSMQIKENERKDLELRKALDKERELNQIKSKFVSAASHEFRTPLSGILASTYLLSKYTKQSDQELRDKHIKRILTSVKHLNEVLGDFLSVDKIEQGDFKPNLTEFHIEDMINEIIQNLQYMLKKNQEIKYFSDYKASIVYLDHSMFHYILTNLLTNAIKYSPENSVIKLSIQRSDHQLRLSVKDQGVGIPKAEQQNLYRRFYRGSNVAQFQGTGLGLSIVKKYVDILDGTIECISETNQGAEFIVIFNDQKDFYENNIDS